MAYREVAVFEVREVLRLWLALLAFRRIAEMVRCDRKTVTKIVRVAEAQGLVRTDSPDRLTDDFVGGVVAEMAPRVPDRHGEAWKVLVAHREKLEGWHNDDVPAVKMVELLGRQGVVVPERTLNRYLAAEFGAPERSTVPVVDGEPGVEWQVASVSSGACSMRSRASGVGCGRWCSPPECPDTRLCGCRSTRTSPR